MTPTAPQRLAIVPRRPETPSRRSVAAKSFENIAFSYPTPMIDRCVLSRHQISIPDDDPFVPLVAKAVPSEIVRRRIG